MNVCNSLLVLIFSNLLFSQIVFSKVVLDRPASNEFTDVITINQDSEGYCSESSDSNSIDSESTDLANQDSNNCKMTYDKAVEFCEKFYSRLPTVRHFAKWSISRGARGIVEVSHPTRLPNIDPQPGYYYVGSIYADGSTDHFFFNHEGFVRPEGPIGEAHLWTSSTAIQNKDYAHVFYGSFGGGGGDPREHHKNYPNSVVCLK